MSMLMDHIYLQLHHTNLDSIANQAGLNVNETQTAVAHLMPVMIESLARQVFRSPEAAEVFYDSLSPRPQQSGASTNPSANGCATVVMTAPCHAELQAADVDDETLNHVADLTNLDRSQLKRLLPQLSPILIAALRSAKNTQRLSSVETAAVLQAARRHLQEQVTTALGYVRSHPNEIKSGMIGAGMALSGNYMLRRMFDHND